MILFSTQGCAADAAVLVGIDGKIGRLPPG